MIVVAAAQGCGRWTRFSGLLPLFSANKNAPGAGTVAHIEKSFLECYISGQVNIGTRRHRRAFKKHLVLRAMLQPLQPPSKVRSDTSIKIPAAMSHGCYPGAKLRQIFERVDLIRHPWSWSPLCHPSAMARKRKPESTWSSSKQAPQGERKTL